VEKKVNKSERFLIPDAAFTRRAVVVDKKAMGMRASMVVG
jgi:hypothetical protein